MSNFRKPSYWILSLLLLGASTLLYDAPWKSSVALHTAFEIMATCMASIAGGMALVRYYSRPERKFLFVGTGLVAAGFLDGFHMVVSSVWFMEHTHTAPSSMIAWSWLASRLYLSLMLMLSIQGWQQQRRLHTETSENEKAVYLLTATIIIASYCLLILTPLPPAYLKEGFITRPEDLLPGVFFMVALIGYLRLGTWRSSSFDYWLVMALIVNCIGQLGFMALSGEIFDAYFDAAHILKIFSYGLVMVGLFNSTYRTYKRLEEETYEHAQANLRNHMLAMAIEKSPLAVIITRASDNSIEYCNSRALDTLNFRKEQVIGQNPRIFASGKTPQSTYAAMWASLRAGREWVGTFINHKSNGEEVIAEAHISPIFDEQQYVSHYVAINYDITERSQQEKINWHKANYDLLTGLPNRGLFLDRVENALKNAKRLNSQIAVLFIDLDGFKPVNDTYGHDAGDQLLQWVSKQIAEAIRDSDSVGRYGGDEFTLLLTDFATADEVVLVAEKVLAAIRQPFACDDSHVSISASIGIALYPSHGQEPEELIKHADIAMYQVKKEGGGQIAFHGYTSPSH